MKVAEQFYTKNGVPISEDLNWNYNTRYATGSATTAEKLRLKPNYTTANLNFDREVRFYASLGFDGARWFGQGRFNDEEPVYMEAKLGQISNNHAWAYSMTGYWAKKLVNPQSVSSVTEITIQSYLWPVIRLADIYLLHAEALNEWQGPSEAYKWIDLVEEKSGPAGRGNILAAVLQKSRRARKQSRPAEDHPPGKSSSSLPLKGSASGTCAAGKKPNRC